MPLPLTKDQEKILKTSTARRKSRGRPADKKRIGILRDALKNRKRHGWEDATFERMRKRALRKKLQQDFEDSLKFSLTEEL